MFRTAIGDAGLSRRRANLATHVSVHDLTGKCAAIAMQNFRYQQDLSATGNCAGDGGNREAILDIGSLWDRMGLVRQLGISNPVYVGRNTAEEWRLLIDAKERVAVPVAKMGGPGSEWSHWRESVLLNELMTPSLNTSQADRPRCHRVAARYGISG